MTCANLQGSRVQIYEGTSESRMLATLRGGCLQYKFASGCLDLFLAAVAKRALCRGNRSARVVGAANRAVKCRRPQSAVYNLRSTVCGGRWSYDGPRTDLQTRERPVLCGCSVLLLRAGAGRWIYGMQMRQVRRFGALDSKNDLQKDFYHKEHQTHIDRICNASITRHPPWKKKRSARSRLLLLA